MVSETLQIENVDQKVDLSGLHNVTKKSDVIVSSEPTDQLSDASTELPLTSGNQETRDDKKMIFPDTVSVNSVTTEGYVPLIK